MPKMFSQTFSADQSSDQAPPANEYEPLGGEEPTDPGNPVANEYEPLGGGEPNDPGDPAA